MLTPGLSTDMARDSANRPPLPSSRVRTRSLVPSATMRIEAGRQAHSAYLGRGKILERIYRFTVDMRPRPVRIFLYRKEPGSRPKGSNRYSQIQFSAVRQPSKSRNLKTKTPGFDKLPKVVRLKEVDKEI